MSDDDDFLFDRVPSDNDGEGGRKPANSGPRPRFSPAEDTLLRMLVLPCQSDADFRESCVFGCKALGRTLGNHTTKNETQEAVAKFEMRLITYHIDQDQWDLGKLTKVHDFMREHMALYRTGVPLSGIERQRFIVQYLRKPCVNERDRISWKDFAFLLGRSEADVPMIKKHAEWVESDAYRRGLTMAKYPMTDPKATIPLRVKRDYKLLGSLIRQIYEDGPLSLWVRFRRACEGQP